MTLDRQIERIQERVDARCIAVYARTTETDVAAFEERHQISLPAGYRRFILDIGNGGRGPVDIFKLGSYREQTWAQLPWEMIELTEVAEEFIYTSPWIWESEEWTPDELADAKADIYDGSICIGYGGCGEYYHLIVNGDERGHVWHFSGVGICPVSDAPAFLDWYERWLLSHESLSQSPSATREKPWWQFWPSK